MNIESNWKYYVDTSQPLEKYICFVILLRITAIQTIQTHYDS